MTKKKTENVILTTQKSQITEHFVYQKLSQSATDPHNKKVLKQISDDLTVQLNIPVAMLENRK
jgi:hypothetical protein